MGIHIKWREDSEVSVCVWNANITSVYTIRPHTAPSSPPPTNHGEERVQEVEGGHSGGVGGIIDWLVWIGICPERIAATAATVSTATGHTAVASTVATTAATAGWP